MKIVITGSTGLIGRACVEFLSSQHEIIALYRGQSEGKIVQSKMAAYIKTDYSTEDLIRKFKTCDGIIHLAGQKAVSGEPEGIRHYWESVMLTERVFEAAKACGIDNIVYTSSRCVYGNYTSSSFSEDDTIIPINFYGVAKAMVEQMAEYYNTKYNMNIKTLRLSQVVGFSFEGNNMFAAFLKQACNNGDITVFGEGKAIRDYIYIADVCCGIEQTFMAMEKKGIFNLGSGQGNSIVGIAEKILETTHSNGKVVHLKGKAEDSSRIVLNMKKTQKELGIIPRYDICHMIKDILIKKGNLPA